MPIQARNHAEGRHVYRETFVRSKTTYHSSGHISHDQWSSDHAVHMCTRFKGHSPIRLLPGTSTPWRDPTPYERSVIEINREAGKSKWKDPNTSHYEIWEEILSEDGFNNESFSPYGAFDSPSVQWPEALKSSCIVKATQQIKDQKASFGENLAEAQKTYRGLYTLGTQLLTAALAVKRGNPGLAWDILRDNRSVVRRGADLYLQYKFGWKPLMSDIYSLSDLLKGNLQKAMILSGYGSGEEAVTAISKHDRERSGSGTRKVRTKLYGMLDGQYSHMADQLGLTNPLRLAWDLVPYSFVVDWFMPVGDVLDALQPPQGVKFIGGYSTVRGEIKFTSTWKAGEDPNMSSVSPRTNHVNMFSMRRESYTDWPRAGLYFTSPFSWSDRASTERGKSSIALLIQRLLK